MAATRLDPAEEHHRVPIHREGLGLFQRRLASAGRPTGSPVLYVHGATFPSALSIAHRFDGMSWRDALVAAGHDVWAFDFLGFGESDRYPEMSGPADAAAPLCAAEDAALQVESAVRCVIASTRAERVSLVAHSWGSMPACLFAGRHPGLVDRIVLFAPIGRREGGAPVPDLPAWRDVTLAQQWQRFVEDVPEAEPPVLSRAHFSEWGERYLDSDRSSRTRDPASVRVPNGPTSDNLKAFAGELPYDPALVQAPVAVLRGAWDHLCTDADAARLFEAFSASPVRRDVKIGRGTHLMHLESMRLALWRESIVALAGDDVAPVPA